MQTSQLIDLGRLDEYIVIRMQSGTELSPDNDDLRVLDQDLGPAVNAIWSEKGQGIVAFVFDKSYWDPVEAKAWVDQAKERGKEAAKATEDNSEGQAPEGSDEPEDTSPLYAFWLALGDGADAESPDDGLLWKEILHPGKWFKTDSGRAIEVTPEMIGEVYRAFNDGYPRYVSVPADHHWTMTRGIVPPEANRGFLKKLRKLGDRLFAGFAFTKPETEAGVRDGSIADVSVYLQPSVHHNGTGKRYEWALRHVLLTNNPLASDLAQWGDIPADDADDGGRLVFNHVQKATEDHMAEENEGITLTGEAADEYESLREAGYTTAQLLELAERMQDLEGVGLSVGDLIEKAQGLRQKARDLELAQIAHALEGADEHPSVTQIEGYRHYPVVVEAVTKALDEGASGLAMAADEDGCLPVDGLILSIVNAIPETGRVPVAASEQRGRKDEKATPSVSDTDAEVTDEQVDEFLATVG